MSGSGVRKQDWDNCW